MKFYPEENDPQKDYNYYFQQMEAARQRLSLGGRTISEDFNDPSFKDRWDERFRSFNIVSNPFSSFSANEQLNLARMSMMSSAVLRGADLGFGAMNLGSMMLPGGMVAGAGYNLGISGVRYGFQQAMIDPLINSRLFSSNAFLSSRDSIGGLMSSTGVGGLSMQQSMSFGRTIEDTFRRGNSNLNGEQIGQIVNSAAAMPQMQFVGNIEQAVQNMSKYLEVVGKLVKQLGPDKLTDILTSMRQFGALGMSVGQSETAFNNIRGMGSSLNMDPSKIMSFGVGTAGQFMGTGISQVSGFNWGVSNLNAVERMRQSGGLLPQQLLNFGGSEGIAQMLTNAQSRFMQNPISDIFLKSMYSNGLSANDIQSGNFSLQQARLNAANVTLNPSLNMSYGYDKDFLISQFNDPRAASYSMMNKLFSQGSPFGTGLTGRARWLQSIGMASDKQSARLLAQDWMSTDPLGQIDSVQDAFQRDQFMAGQDPYFSSQGSLGRMVSGIGRSFSRGWSNLRRDTFGFIPGTDTQQSARFERGLLNAGQSLFGMGDMVDWMVSNTTPMDLMGNPLSRNMNASQFRNSLAGMNSPEVVSKMKTQELARNLLYSNQEVAMDDLTQDRVRDVRRIIKDKYSGRFGGNMSVDQMQTTIGDIYSDFSSNYKYAGLEDDITMRGGFKGKFGDLVKGVIANEVAGDNRDLLLKEISKQSPVGGLNIPMSSTNSRLTRFGLNIASPLTIPFTIGGSLDDAASNDYRSIQSRLMSSDVNTQAKMMQYMQELSASPDSSIRPTSQQMSWFGGISDKSLKGFYGTYGSQLQDLLNPTKVQQMQGEEDKVATRSAIHALFNSPGYQDALRGSNLPSNLLEQLTLAASSKDQSLLSGISVDPQSYKNFAKSFAGSPGGIGVLLNKLVTAGDNGELSLSGRKQDYEKFTDELQVLMQKKFEGNERWKNAQEIWDNKRFSQALTVQDHATATAMGLRIFYGDNEKSQWNTSFNKSDNPT